MILQNFWANLHTSAVRICKPGSEHGSSIRTYGNCVLQPEHDSSAYKGYVQRFGQNITLRVSFWSSAIRTSPNPKTSFKQPAALLWHSPATSC